MRVAFISLYTAYPPTCGAGYVTSSCARLTPCETLLVQLSDRANIEHAGNLTIVSVRKDISTENQAILRRGRGRTSCEKVNNRLRFPMTGRENG